MSLNSLDSFPLTNILLKSRQDPFCDFLLFNKMKSQPYSIWRTGAHPISFPQKDWERWTSWRHWLLFRCRMPRCFVKSSKRESRLKNLFRSGTIFWRLLLMKRAETDLSAPVLSSVDRFEPLFKKAGCEVKVWVTSPVKGNWDPHRLEIWSRSPG